MNLLDFNQFPGGDLIKQGIIDCQEDRQTIFSCLIQIGFPTLSKMQILPREIQQSNQEDAELILYRILKSEVGDAYSRYNALMRELLSFERAISLEGMKEPVIKIA
jgi:hypothetical protein